MGKGDKKSKRGKIFKGTFGVRRPHHIIIPIVEKASPEPEPALVVETPVKKTTKASKKI